MAGTDLDDVPTGSGRERRPREKPMHEKVQMLKLGDEWKRTRLFGKVYSQATHWVCFKDKEGRIDPKKRFPVVARGWNPETNNWDPERYDPFFEFSKQQRAELFDTGEELSDKEKQKLKDKMLVQTSIDYYMLAIDRDAQKKLKGKKIKPTKAERRTGFKDMESDTPTPIRVCRATGGLLDKIKNLTSLNVSTGKDGKTRGYAVTDPKRGIDIVIQKQSKPKSPGDTYQVNIKGDDPKRITDEEESFLKFDIEAALQEAMTEKEMTEEFNQWAKRMGVKLMAKAAKTNKKGKGRKDEDLRDDEDQDEDEEESSSKKKGKGKKAPPKGKGPAAKKGKGKSSKDDDDEDEDDDDLDEDDEDEDEDDEPKSKKKGKAAKGKGRKSDDDDEDEDDEDDEDEDEDDEDSDDDEDDDDSDDDEDEDDDDSDDDEDEDDEDDEDDDSDDDEDDEDEDDSDDEDEDDDDEDEDDDDEDDEPVKKGKGKAAKSSKKAPAKKAAKKTAKKAPAKKVTTKGGKKKGKK